MNILPNFRTLDAKKEDKFSNWNTRTSFLPSKNFSCLGINTDDIKKVQRRSHSSMKYKTCSFLPPNERYINNNNYSNSNPSPLGSLLRGCSMEPSKIVLPEELTREVKIMKPLQNSKNLVIGVYNLSTNLDSPLELFVHKNLSTMQSTPVKPGCYMSRTICGQFSQKSVRDTNLLLCATCRLGNVIVHLPATKMMRNFQFKEGPIGLELENQNDHVTCHRVVPLSQAAVYRDELVGAEIVSINNGKISSLADFHQLLALNEDDEVTLRAIVTVALEPKAISEKITDNWLGRSRRGSVMSAVNKGGGTYSSDGSKEDYDDTKMTQVTSIYRGEDDNLIAAVKNIRNKLDHDPSEKEDEWNLPSWRYTTTVDTPEEEAEEEEEELTVDLQGREGSMHIAYMPTKSLTCSKLWGSPKSLLQISNLSAEWSVGIYWVDEDGVLIFRKTLNTGDRHMEMTSGDHLWAMSAHLISDQQGVGSPSTEPSNMCLIRPCDSSLLRSQCVSLLWMPNRSLTASQRCIRPFEQSHRSDGKAYFRSSKPSFPEPSMHVQIL